MPFLPQLPYLVENLVVIYNISRLTQWTDRVPDIASGRSELSFSISRLGESQSRISRIKRSNLNQSKLNQTPQSAMSNNKVKPIKLTTLDPS
jgi:hypothetical protein